MKIKKCQKSRDSATLKYTYVFQLVNNNAEYVPVIHPVLGYMAALGEFL